MPDFDIATDQRGLKATMRNISKPVLIGGGIVFTAIIAFLAFGVFGVHLLFIDEEVAEANPFAVSAEATPTTEPAVAEGDADEAPTEEEAAADEAAADEAVEGSPESAEGVAPGVVTVTSGSFTDGDHPTSGTGLTITDGNQTFLRFEGFETDNGPDLNVYLRNSDDPDDYLDLGDLKGNIGDQNYELPEGTDLDTYDFVDIWCVRFGVSFGTAQLSA